jgi:diadenosine tetraphosphate (Ap4A) HIT family hydrolase/alpha/beta superfamily hydrolase
MAADVIRLLDHLHIERAHLVGYSMGAGITFKLLVDHPERILSAMPCGIGLRPPTAEEREFYAARASALEQAGRTGSARDQSGAEAPLNEGVRRFVEVVSQGNDAAAMAAVLRTIYEVMPDVSELEHNSVPSLSIFGEHDEVAGIAWTAERMANLDVKIIEGANHFTTPDNPEFVPAIKSFVGKHGITPPARQRGMVHGCEACDLLAPGAPFLDRPLESDDLLVYESEFFKVYQFPGDQGYLGRCLVVLERHSSSLADLSSDEWEGLQDVVQVMEGAARRAFGAVGFNWTCLMNKAFREDSPQPHVHLHFRPRYAAAVEFNGSLFEDELFGEHYNRERVPVTAEMAVAIVAALREAVRQVR